MTYKPEIKVAFCLMGIGFSPDEITSALGLQPTRTWRLDDSICGTLRRYQHDGWCLGLPCREEFNVEMVLSEMLDTIEPHLEPIKTLVDNYNLNSEISCGIYTYGQSPILHFSADTLRRLCHTGAELDIDIIAFPERE
jgi:hypothetical protein